MPFRLLLLFLLALPVYAAADARLDQIATLFKQREWARAQTLLEEFTAAEPQNAEAWLLLGQCQLARQNLDPAVTSLEKATALAPTDSDAFLALGNAYGAAAQKAGLFSKLGLARKSKAAFARAVELDPASINARWNLMEYCRQAPAIAGGGMEEAYTQAEEIRKINPDRGRVALASLYVGEKKMIEAFDLFDEALRAHPDDYATLYQLGRLCALTGQRLDQGIEVLRKCITLPIPEGQPGRAPANWRLGQLLEKKGDHAAARQAYEAAVVDHPEFVPALEALRKLPTG